jgi:hypothetical protein
LEFGGEEERGRLGNFLRFSRSDGGSHSTDSGLLLFSFCVNRNVSVLTWTVDGRSDGREGFMASGEPCHEEKCTRSLE